MKPDVPLRRRELALPFALIGLVGGGLTAIFFQVDPLAPGARGEDRLIGWLLFLLTPLTAAALGASLAGSVREPQPRRALVVIGATFLAGVVNGALLGLFVGFVWGAILGAVMGLLASVPFLPPIMVVMAAARAVGRARAGSVVDSADRRGVLRAAAVAILLAIAVAALLWTPGVAKASPFVSLSRFSVVAGLPLLAVLLGLDVTAWVRAGRVVALGAALAPAPAPEVPSHLLDFGVGDGAIGVPSPASYRSPEAVRPWFLGDPGSAHRLLARAALVSAVSLVVAALAAVIALTAA